MSLVVIPQRMARLKRERNRLAGHTRRLVFCPLVSPLSFRHPTMLARMAASLDNLSGGRLVRGLDAGWQERQHNQLVHLLGRWADAGVQRIMIQWLDLDDLDGLEGFAHKVLPQLL